jgi:hypothetical protein
VAKNSFLAINPALPVPFEADRRLGGKIAPGR